MKEKILPRIKHWFLRFLQLQLVISLTLLLILPSWGLPMSILSPIGNMLYMPIFTVFLLLSSTIFFLEVLCVPNEFLIYILEKLTSVWIWLIPDFNNVFLIGFTKPPLLFLIILPIAIIIILTNKRIKTIQRSIVALFLLFILASTYLKIINKPCSFVKDIPCNNGCVTFIYNKGNVALIDPGYIGSRVSAISWISYTLAPEIIKSCGKTNIDHLIIMQPGKITFDAIQVLLHSLKIKKLYLVNFYGLLKRNTAISLYKLKELAQKRNTVIVRIGKKEEYFPLDKTSKITMHITPQKKSFRYNKTKYPGLCVACTIDNQAIKIYSAKMKM